MISDQDENANAGQDGCLDDVRVVECADYVSGPFSGRLLADLGAEVIKVERPGLGDRARLVGPFPDDIPHSERSGLFIYLNANKLGVTIESDSQQGREILAKLIATADVFIEDGYIADGHYGPTYQALAESNPGLIVVSIRPFGLDGSRSAHKGSDLIAWHSGGVGYFSPYRISDPEQDPPLRPGGHAAEFCAGLAAANVTLAALLARDLSGKGQHIDISQQEAILMALSHNITMCSYLGTSGDRGNSGFGGGGGIFPCKDGYVELDFPAPEQWTQTVHLIGDPDWAQTDFFDDRVNRGQNWDFIQSEISRWTMSKTRHEVVSLAQESRIACLPVNTAEDLLACPQLAERQVLTEYVDPDAGRVVAPRLFRLEGWNSLPRFPAPRLGQHNKLILAGLLGYSEGDLAQFLQSGIV